MVAVPKKSEVIDPNILQRQASNPESSIWVSASAGTGKTKVLTDRVLRLLLPRSDGRPGTPSHKILCLTFTKAAANEMALRIQNILGKWAIIKDEELRSVLKDLLGQDATDLQYDSARRLFAENIDSMNSLRVLTIHSFCQSVLGRFPLECGLSPYFVPLEESGATALLKTAQGDVFRRLRSDEMIGSQAAAAMHNLLSALDEERFIALVKSVISERGQFDQLLKTYGSVDGVYSALCNFFSIDQNVTVEALNQQLCTSPYEDDLRRVTSIMLQNGQKTDLQYGTIIIEWLNSSADERKAMINAYKGVFIKTDGDLRTHNFPTKAVLNVDPASSDILRAESHRIGDLYEHRKCLESASLTRDILLIGHEILLRYDALKNSMGALDFNDLIYKTLKLLNNQSAWVMYKLDEGLDHILVDEAQDTNPEQWGIALALCTEFFNGLGARDDLVRTSFTVGDIKQSIYSFQRASPAEFQRVQHELDRMIAQSGNVNSFVALETSFRTTKSVLRVVDQVFSYDDLNSYIGGGEIQHISYRKGQAGLVELWPLYETEKKEGRDPWMMPTQIVEHQSSSVQLADKIAETIRNWLDRNEFLEAYGRAIQPGDIMILVRSRNAFVENLMRSLKQRNVPVGGSDRMVLHEQLVVQDLMAMARFCLLPEDDLTLAEVLKSPFVGLDEDELFSLAYNRSGSLWSELCNFNISRLDGVKSKVVCLDDSKREAIRIYLSEMIGRVRQMGVYEFLSYLLTQSCPSDVHSGLNSLKRRLGDDVLDPLQEFLSEALNFGYESLDHMQLFIEYYQNSQTEIKREMEEAGKCVRIMTVHGSKGLQAPIVILPDTILSASSKKPDRLLWPDKTGLDIPLYSIRGENDPQQYAEIFNKREALDREEYFRLLYVAMTRAEERLYIAGHVGSKKGRDYSWYYKIKKAMTDDPECIEMADGTLRVENKQIEKPDKASMARDDEEVSFATPVWLQHNAPEEPLPPRPLVPSRPSLDDSEVTLSPLLSNNESRFKRGNITHKLLQFLPDIDANIRRGAAQQFVQKHAADLSNIVQQSIVEEVLSVLNNPDYAPFFATGSLAEVPVTGLMKDGRIVSGQIDRLVVSYDQIWILDYKSNRPPPQKPEDVQAVYKRQLIAYRDSVAQIYQGRKIHCALLWTDGPVFMIMDDYI